MWPGPIATSLDSSEDILVCGQKLGLATGTTSNIYEGKFILAPPAAEGDHLLVARNKAGAELGGVALAAATAMETGKNWVIIRSKKKGYGKDKLIEGVLKPDDVVLLVEDVATTGRAAQQAAEVITEGGATVKKIVCVIDRKQGAAENITQAGYKFESILTKNDLGIKNSSSE